MRSRLRSLSSLSIDTNEPARSNGIISTSLYEEPISSPRTLVTSNSLSEYKAPNGGHARSESDNNEDKVPNTGHSRSKIGQVSVNSRPVEMRLKLADKISQFKKGIGCIKEVNLQDYRGEIFGHSIQALLLELENYPAFGMVQIDARNNQDERELLTADTVRSFLQQKTTKTDELAFAMEKLHNVRNLKEIVDSVPEDIQTPHTPKCTKIKNLGALIFLREMLLLDNDPNLNNWLTSSDFGALGIDFARCGLQTQILNDTNPIIAAFKSGDEAELAMLLAGCITKRTDNQKIITPLIDVTEIKPLLVKIHEKKAQITSLVDNAGMNSNGKGESLSESLEFLSELGKQQIPEQQEARVETRVKKVSTVNKPWDRKSETLDTFFKRIGKFVPAINRNDEMGDIDDMADASAKIYPLSSNYSQTSGSPTSHVASLNRRRTTAFQIGA